MKVAKTVKRVKLSQLKDHPKQAELFGDVSEQDLRLLADNMQANGQEIPIEVLPDGTIVAGQQRVRAARLLGWTEIDAIVRKDLAKAGAAATEARLIADNLVRRQLSTLARARCLRRLLELEPCSQGLEAAKARIGRVLGLSSRSVNRYLALLATPLEIQRAFERGELPIIMAGKIAAQSPSSQRRIAERIQAGEPAQTAVRRCLPLRDGYFSSRRSPLHAFARLVKQLGEDLAEHIDALPDPLIEELRPALQRGQEVIRQLLARPPMIP